MSACRTLILSVPLLLLAGTAGAAGPEKPPTREQIAKWVRDLGAADFSVREEASEKLWAAGRHAEAALQEAAKSDDTEVRRRARELLEKFRWGIYPDTPRAVLALINEYRAADPAGKRAAFRKMFALGPAAGKTLAKLAQAEKDPQVRADLMQLLADELGRVVPDALAKREFDSLEAIVELALAQNLEAGVRNYAAYWLMRGKLKERIAHHKDLAAKNVEPAQQWEILTYLHRANGDLPAARQAAEKAGKRTLVEDLLVEEGNWEGLFKRLPLTRVSDPVEQLGWQTALARLTGKEGPFTEAIKALHKHAEMQTDRDDLFQVAKVLLVNGRVEEAFPLLVKSHNRRVQFEVLASQMKIPEAFAVVEKARADASEELPELEIAQARLFHVLGARDKATAVFRRYGEQIKPGTDESWFQDLVKTEARLGLRDQAFDHAAQVLAVSADEGWVGRLFPELFREHGDTAEELYQLLRLRTPGLAPSVTLKALRPLIEGKAAEKDVADLVEVARKNKRDTAPVELTRRLVALGKAARLCGHADQARALLEEVARQASPVTLNEDQRQAWVRSSARSLRLLADGHADRKEWLKAAELYHQAWQRDRSEPLALYLSGDALEQAGQKEAGKERKEQAHWLPLGNEALRNEFLSELVKRRHRDGADREADLLLRLGRPGSFYIGEALRHRGLMARRRDDFAGAARGQEQAMLRCLGRFVRFVSPAAYVGVPSHIHQLRARALLAAGKPDEARKHIDLSRALQPANVDLPILLVPQLERIGRKAEADGLYEGVRAVYEKVCKDYPDCSWAHNSAAWLSACCRRDLDKGLAHARKAVALSPDSASHLDTLAEVLFQLGKKEEAVQTQKKAVKLDPEKPYYRKQLARIEAGDPQVPRPVEE